MRYLSSFFDFLFESDSKNELPIYYSKRLRSMLSKLSDKDKIAQKLVSIEGNASMASDNCVLFDITDNDDTISFKQLSRIERYFSQNKDTLINQGFTNVVNYIYHAWRNQSAGEYQKHWSEQRSEIKIGRYVRKLNDRFKWGFIDSDIEKFVNLYKSTFSFDKSAETRMELVSGEDIRKWYLEDNYAKGGGSLNNSCMRYQNCQRYFDLYAKNTDVCQLLILKSEDPEKISGRALVWKLSGKHDGQYYMDRIYTSNDSDVHIFEEYAAKKGWFKMRDRWENRTVQLGKYEYKTYPYMDSFMVYDEVNHSLHNDEGIKDGNKNCLFLQDTGGGYERGGEVWSEWHGEYYDEEDLVWCENADSYVLRDEAQWLEYRREWAAPTDEVVYSDYHDQSFYQDDVVYSELMSDTLNSEYDGVIEIRINDKGDTDWGVVEREDLYIKVGDEYYSRKEYIKDPYTGEYHFTDEKMGDTTYKDMLKSKIKEETGDVGDGVKVSEQLEEMIPKIEIDEGLLEIIRENRWYQTSSRNSSLIRNLRSDEILPGIFAYLVTKNYNPFYINSTSRVRYYENIKKFCKSEETLKKYELIYTQNSSLINNIGKIASSFNYELLGNEVYKRHIYMNL